MGRQSPASATMIIPAPTSTKSEPPISSGPFWPQIDPVEIREQQRIDNTVTPQRLRSALFEAIANANYELQAWQADRVAEGSATLADVGAPEIEGTSILVHRYFRAVGCLAKAMLIERLRDFDTTAKGERKTEDIGNILDDCRRDYRHAISDILGKPRSTVDLI